MISYSFRVYVYYFLASLSYLYIFFFFFFNDTATTEIYTLSLHDALPISNTKPKARSNPALSTRNFSRSGAAWSGGVLRRLPPPSLQPIRMSHAWNSLYAREIRKIPAASGPPGTALIRNQAIPWKCHPRALS